MSSTMKTEWRIAVKPEQLPRHISTQQLMRLLDEMLESGLGPLLLHTTYIKRLLIQVLVQYSSDNRRKMSSVDRDTLYGCLIKASITGEYHHLARCKINRSILLNLITHTYALLEPALNLETQLALNKHAPETRNRLLRERSALAQHLGTHEHVLAPLAAWTKSYIAIYTKFKDMIHSKYRKLAYHSTLRSTFFSSMHIDRNELNSNLNLAVSRAIDQCDGERGTLTHLVNNWFISATNHPEFSHQYGTSYDLPPVIRRERENRGETLTNFAAAMPVDDAIPDTGEDTIESALVRESDPALVNALRYTENSALAMLVLNLPITLTETEKNQLKHHNSIGKLP